MKTTSVFKTLLMGLLLIISTNCGKKDSPAPEPLDAAQFVESIEDGFGDASDSLQTKLDQVFEHFENEDYIECEGAIDEILYTEKLSKDQQTLLGRALITLNALIGEQAREGDPKAIQKLQQYQMTK